MALHGDWQVQEGHGQQSSRLKEDWPHINLQGSELKGMAQYSTSQVRLWRWQRRRWTQEAMRCPKQHI